MGSYCLNPLLLRGSSLVTRPILCFVGRISDSVIRQDRAILLGYAALTQPTI